MKINEKCYFITKRDGSKMPYDSQKIVTAIEKANSTMDREQEKCSPENIRAILDIIEYRLRVGTDISDELSVEKIQDIIVHNLLEKGYEKLALSYEVYRAKKASLRDVKEASNVDAMFKAITGLIGGTNSELMRENSNKDASINSTQRDLIAGEISKYFSRKYMIPRNVVKAHDDGVLHFHDMDYHIQPMFNCCLINLADMLDNGTVMNGMEIHSPHSFKTACTVTTQIVAAVASNQYGGQSIDIRHLGKYLRKSYDKYYEKYTKELAGESKEVIEKMARIRQNEDLVDGVQTIQYQLNTLMTTNGQAPFVTIFLNLIKGDEYEKEVAMIIEEILKQRYEGVIDEHGVAVTPAFPKLIYVLDSHNAESGSEYEYLTDLAVKCSARRMYPDYISAKKMRENYEGNVFSPMGCRSFLSPWKDENGNYKFEGRFNMGVVSINLPQIGIVSEGDMSKFWTEFDARLELCKEALMSRFNRLKDVTSDVSPIHFQYGAIARLGKGEKIEPLLRGGYATISLGYIGLYELTKLMTGESHTSEVGNHFAMEVMKHMKEKCAEWKAETGLGFALYGTPAESLCYRFAKVDKEKFGEIKDVTDKGYYTNSYHIDVREEIDAFSKLKLENEFQPISTGGCISYVEIPNMNNNLLALKALVQFIYNNVQYGEVNTRFDICHKCGFEGEMLINENGEWECPNCHNTDFDEMTVTRRTCG